MVNAQSYIYYWEKMNEELMEARREAGFQMDRAVAAEKKLQAVRKTVDMFADDDTRRRIYEAAGWETES